MMHRTLTALFVTASITVGGLTVRGDEPKPKTDAPQSQLQAANPESKIETKVVEHMKAMGQLLDGLKNFVVEAEELVAKAAACWSGWAALSAAGGVPRVSFSMA